MKNNILLLFTFCALVMSCGKDENVELPELKLKDYGAVLSLDIADAKALYVAKGSTAAIPPGSRTRSDYGVADVTIYKITVDDATSEVVVRDEHGEIIPLISCDLFLLSDDLIGFRFSYDTYNYYVDGDGNEYSSYSERKEETYWIRKSDGAAFKVPLAFWEMRRDHFNTDNNGNMFYFSYGDYVEDGTGHGLYKIYTDTDNGISAKKIGSKFTHEIAGGYIVDGSGNIYFGREYSRLHCIFSDGMDFLSEGYFPALDMSFRNNYSQKHGAMLCVSDDGFYRIQYETGYEDGHSLFVQVDIDAAKAMANSHSVVLELIESLKIKIEREIDYLHIFNREHGVVLIGLYYLGGNSDLIVFNPSAENMITRYPNIDMGYNQIRCSANYAYWVNQAQGAIFRFDYQTGIIEPVYSNSNYDISDLAVGQNDEITFNATNLTNLDKIMCEIKNGDFSEKKIENRTEGSDGEIITFIRVN